MRVEHRSSAADMGTFLEEPFKSQGMGVKGQGT